MTTGFYGLLEKTPDPRDFLYAPSIPYTGAFIDLSSRFPQSPYDQLNLGSCVAQGTVAAVDFARVKMGLPPLDPPSRLFVYYEGRARSGRPLDQDTGLQIRDGFTVVAKDGAPPETDWPYDPAMFAIKPPDAAYVDAELDVAVVYGTVALADIDSTIASGYPITIGFTVHESFESEECARTGVMPIPQRHEQVLGGHCVVLCSTTRDGAEIAGGVSGVSYRLGRNSWGHDGSWGIPDNPGYFWMPNSEVDASDMWVVKTVTSSNPPVPPGPVGDPDTMLAAVARPWAGKRHVGGNATMAKALKDWLISKRL